MDRTCKIEKLVEEQRLVYGTFLIPDIEDSQGDIVSSDDIQKAAHGFMMDYQQIGEVHKSINPNCKVVESYIEPGTGVWKGVVKVLDDTVWEKVKSGEYESFSIGGDGRREPIDGEQA